MWDTVGLFVVGTLLGCSDIVRELLSHPAISHAPYRAADVFAIIHKMPQDSALGAMRMYVWRDRNTHEPWLKMGAVTPGQRQAAFEKYVHTWPETLDKLRRPENWCVEGALFAVLFGHDDGRVCDEKWYSIELVDHARSVGV